MIDICQLHEAVWSLYVSYIRQVGGYLSDTRGRMTVSCHLHESGEQLSVSHMRQVGGNLSTR